MSVQTARESLILNSNDSESKEVKVPSQSTSEKVKGDENEGEMIDVAGSERWARVVEESTVATLTRLRAALSVPGREEWRILLTGPPGTNKSLIAKRANNVLGSRGKGSGLKGASMTMPVLDILTDLDSVLDLGAEAGFGTSSVHREALRARADELVATLNMGLLETPAGPGVHTPPRRWLIGSLPSPAHYRALEKTLVVVIRPPEALGVGSPIGRGDWRQGSEKFEQSGERGWHPGLWNEYVGMARDCATSLDMMIVQGKALGYVDWCPALLAAIYGPHAVRGAVHDPELIVDPSDEATLLKLRKEEWGSG